MSRLNRFKEAQNAPDTGFDAAVEEIRSGRKSGHWIWYVFPQLSGLGTSAVSQLFAIDGEAEGIEFLRDPELRCRLLTIAIAVAEQLQKGRPLLHLMRSDTDARKVASSLTLFGALARKLHAQEGLAEYGALATVAEGVLAVAASQGYPACAYTRRRLDAGHEGAGTRTPRS